MSEPLSLKKHHLEQFQQNFGNYLRFQELQTESATSIQKNNANQNPVYQQIPKRVGKVYQDLVFNNLKSFINQCFPVCQTLLTKLQWSKLSLHFLQMADLHSPYFTEINKHFVDYLYGLSEEQQQDFDIPPYFADLAHYEWVELALDIHPDLEDDTTIYADARLNPYLENLHYAWAVDQISTNQIPSEAVESFLLVYRTPDYRIEFMKVNGLTHLLINFLITDVIANSITYSTKETLLTAFFTAINMDIQENILVFGSELLTQLEKQQIILTS